MEYIIPPKEFFEELLDMKIVTSDKVEIDKTLEASHKEGCTN